MNMRGLNDKLDPVEMLGEVARVEAPPFLLTRIRQRIANVQQRVPGKWVAATALSLVMLMMLNIYLVTAKSEPSAGGGGNELARAMNLLPQNALYD